MADFTISTFKHANITNDTRTPAQNLLKFRGGKRRTTCQTTQKTSWELWTQVCHQMHWLVVLIPLLFKEFIENLKTFCLELKTQKILMSLFLRQKSKLDLGDATSLNQQEKKHTHVITRIRNNVSATNLVFNTFFYLLHFSTFNSHKLHSEIHFAIRKLCINSNTLAFQRLINRLVIQKPNPTFTFSTHF